MSAFIASLTEVTVSTLNSPVLSNNCRVMSSRAGSSSTYSTWVIPADTGSFVVCNCGENGKGELFFVSSFGVQERLLTIVLLLEGVMRCIFRFFPPFISWFKVRPPLRCHTALKEVPCFPAVSYGHGLSDSCFWIASPVSTRYYHAFTPVLVPGRHVFIPGYHIRKSLQHQAFMVG